LEKTHFLGRPLQIQVCRRLKEKKESQGESRSQSGSEAGSEAEAETGAESDTIMLDV
jgi:hypothetical protein